MAKISLESLGHLVAKKRGTQGVRVTAKEIGISAATLSRVENGHLPDLDNFKRICHWLEVDPAKLLGFSNSGSSKPSAAVHFRKDKTMALETASSLANMILSAQRSLMAQEDS